MVKRIIIAFCIVFFASTSSLFAQNTSVKLFSSPLLFYNEDILSYQQILHKYQRYDEMMPFFYGPLCTNKSSLLKKISDEDFGYDLTMVGAKQINSSEWSITYQKIIYGTKKNFKVNCKLINDTCRIYLDEITYKKIFKD
ncbi:MAG: hypothetical protein RLZZ94_1743 [Bacteroidota bacterium]|jgi:hypothetical protein